MGSARIDIPPLVKMMQKYRDVAHAGLLNTMKYKIIVNTTDVSLVTIEFAEKKRTAKLINIGYYRKSEAMFMWHADSNILMKDFICKNLELLSLEWNDSILGEYFKPKVKISFAHHVTLPYFVSAFFALSSLVKFECEEPDGTRDFIMYGLIELGEENPIPFESFIEDLKKIIVI
jgi:hypothetical protein